MPDRPITHLRHVDIAVPDYEKQVAFYEQQWGLTEVGTDGDVTYFAAEGSPEQYVVRVRRAPGEAPGPGRVRCRRPRDRRPAGHPPRRRRTSRWCQRARHAADAGRRLRLPLLRRRRPHRRGLHRGRGPRAPQGRGEVRTSPCGCRTSSSTPPSPRRCGPGTRSTSDFRLSDTLVHPHMGGLMWFMRCNPQHHSMAIARCPHIVAAPRVLRDARARRVHAGQRSADARTEVPKIWGPGRHLAGDNTFTYFHDPNGNTMEYTTELEDARRGHLAPQPATTPSRPEISDQWGTSNPMNEFVSKQMFNDPDKSGFVAPPV